MTKSAAWYKENINIKNSSIQPATNKTKLKEIPTEELKSLFRKIKEAYEKAKVVAVEHKLNLPEEDFWDYLPGSGIAATHSGGEKQIAQHTLLCVYNLP
jgi:hypothetical protein